MPTANPRATRLLALVLACLGSGVAGAAGTPPPASAFGSTPSFSSVAMSPDGTLIAYDAMTSTGQKVVFIRVGDPQPLRILNMSAGTKLRDVVWADSDTALMEVSATTKLPWAPPEQRNKFELWRTMAVNVNGGDPRVMLFDGNRDLVTGADLLMISPRRKDTVSMVTWDFTLSKRRETIGTRLTEARRDDGWVLTLFDVDTNSGKGRIVAQGTPYTIQWMVDPDGAPVARVDWKQDDRRASIYVKDGAGWRSILETRDEEPLVLSGFSADGTSLIAIGEHGTDFRKAWELPIDGSPLRLAYEHPGTDITRAVRDRQTGRVVGYWLAEADSSSNPVYVDPERRAVYAALVKAFPGLWVYVLDRSTDGQRLLVKAERESYPPTYYLVDRAARRADTIGEAYPGLAHATLGEVQEIRYPARDGTPIPAFLTLPPGQAARDLPLVVLVHGGPEGQDLGGFDWWAQFLVSRGYAVLQPQFRGSTGYGTAHRLAGYGQWGGLMQDDVTDGVHHLVKEGIANPKRVCIMGASYGGYSALAGAAFTPDLYACAVSVNGVSDLPQMIGDVKSGGEESDALAYWLDHIGSPNDPKVAAASPARAAAQVRAPVLLIYGTDDTVVPPSQSTKMASALKAAGKPYEIVTLPGEDHWLSNGATRTAVLQQIEAFLAKHL